MNTAAKPAVTFREAFRFWLKLGFVSFGGPAGQIAIMQKELVENRRWIDQEDFLHALNFCMLLPGPEAQQLATYMGWRLHGIRGGIVAGAFFVLPSVFFLLLLSYIYAVYGNLPQVNAILEGFKAVVVAIVIEAVLKIGKKAFKSFWHILIAAFAFAGIYFFQIPFPLIIICAAILGFLFLQTPQGKTGAPEIPAVENQKNISRFQPLKVFAVCVMLWLVPFVVLISLLGYENLLTQVYLFFTQAAFITFGGAYAVLAYVNQAVVNSGWLTTAQTVDGLALAETTPGPLIMVLQFVGFMTGWNNPPLANQTVSAITSALLATYATFLPSFFFIFIGAPYIDKLRVNKKVTGALSGVMAAVVGVILNLAIMFGAAVILPGGQLDAFALLMTILSFVGLYFFKADVLVVIIGGGLISLAKYFVFG